MQQVSASSILSYYYYYYYYYYYLFYFFQCFKLFFSFVYGFPSLMKNNVGLKSSFAIHFSI
ncbi:MAG: hypothetical protein K7J15_05960, partial [Candidatus Regiella insecticola]|nr:hypothetical protein [Candidatus Regiella insecticola]